MTGFERRFLDIERRLLGLDVGLRNLDDGVAKAKQDEILLEPKQPWRPTPRPRFFTECSGSYEMDQTSYVRYYTGFNEEHVVAVPYVGTGIPTLYPTEFGIWYAYDGGYEHKIYCATIQGSHVAVYQNGTGFVSLGIYVATNGSRHAWKGAGGIANYEVLPEWDL